MDEGTLCLSSWQYDSVGFYEIQRDLMEPDESSRDEDKHKAPHPRPRHPQLHLLSLMNIPDQSRECHPSLRSG